MNRMPTIVSILSFECWILDMPEPIRYTHKNAKIIGFNLVAIKLFLGVLVGKRILNVERGPFLI